MMNTQQIFVESIKTDKQYNIDQDVINLKYQLKEGKYRERMGRISYYLVCVYKNGEMYYDKEFCSPLER